MNCDNIKNLLPEYMEGSLSSKTEAAVKQHLEVCPDCKKTLEALSLTETLLRNQKNIPAPEYMRSNIMNKIKKSQKTSIFDVFFGVGHNPFGAGIAVGAALLLLAVASINVVNYADKTSKFETYQTANASSAYSSQFTISSNSNQ